MNPRNKFILIGAIAGAALGAIAAYTYFQQQEQSLFVKKKDAEGHEMEVKAGPLDFMRIGLTMIGVVRTVQGMLRPM